MQSLKWDYHPVIAVDSVRLKSRRFDRWSDCVIVPLVKWSLAVKGLKDATPPVRCRIALKGLSELPETAQRLGCDAVGTLFQQRLSPIGDLIDRMLDGL